MMYRIIFIATLQLASALPQTRGPTATSAGIPAPTGGVVDYTCTDDVAGISSKGLVKRGNCFPRAQQEYLDYYTDPPSINRIIRPADDRAVAGTQYGAYRPLDDPQPRENLPEPPENVVNAEEFDIRMDEFRGDGLDFGALDFERGVVGVPGGVGGGYNTRVRLGLGREFDGVIEEGM
ncbi:hypothetical protein TWF481_011459 [Arthrobotrys musiformis]|uniref:Uncharacterized protein n=1 Tax=Arthrobotrys musiformis TaxID=47236 RepID=A0AAV9W0H9_9PEZI